ncbi:MAG: hypothetical protein KFH87_12360 [Bacteroidetes bacterium]|nr:hypothetical protein [Bacteroidota bacterium]
MAPPPARASGQDEIEEALFATRRDLFSELSLVFFDTTAMYFEGTGGEDIGWRGHSKDHRPGDPQMVVGMVLDNQAIRSARRCGRATPWMLPR